MQKDTLDGWRSEALNTPSFAVVIGALALTACLFTRLTPSCIHVSEERITSLEGPFCCFNALNLKTISKNHHKDVTDAPAFQGPLLMTAVQPTDRFLESKREGRIIAYTGTPRDCSFKRRALSEALVQMLDSLALV